MDEEELKMQILMQQMQQMKEQLGQIEENLQEMKIVRNAVKKISKTEKDSEILAPLSSGIFVRAKLIDNKNFFVNVGAETTVEKTDKEVIEIINDQLKKLEEVKERINENNKLLSKQLGNLKNV